MQLKTEQAGFPPRCRLSASVNDKGLPGGGVQTVVWLLAGSTLHSKSEEEEGDVQKVGFSGFD